MLGAPIVADAMTSATVIGPQLDRRTVSILSLHDGMLRFFDAERDLREDRLDRFIQIRDLKVEARARAKEKPAVEKASFITLTDGQRLVGEWVDGTAEGQALRWRHPQLGVFAVELRRIAVISLGGTEPPAGDRLGDALWLNNGDRLEGLLASVGEGEVSWQPQDAEDDATLSIPLDRIAAFRLSNPGRRDAPTGHLVWLRDGTGVRGDRLSIAKGVLSVIPQLAAESSEGRDAAAAVTIAMSTVLRIDLHSRMGRLVDLRHCPMSVVGGGEVFGLEMPPRRVGDALWLHAPVVVRVDLPEGAQRFAAQVELATGVESTMTWADLDIVVDSGTEHPMRYRLHRDEPMTQINIAVKGRRLLIELAPGRNGPLMDRILMRNGLLFVAGEK
ncbi:MAG: hypothetical protein CMJ18_15380 [Phycisphaeraceae bacterium]|nr:hypothetical protein [Phycisphaeraceae bacterium]